MQMFIPNMHVYTPKFRTYFCTLQFPNDKDVEGLPTSGTVVLPIPHLPRKPGRPSKDSRQLGSMDYSKMKGPKRRRAEQGNDSTPQPQVFSMPPALVPCLHIYKYIYIHIYMNIVMKVRTNAMCLNVFSEHNTMLYHWVVYTNTNIYVYVLTFTICMYVYICIYIYIYIYDTHTHARILRT